MCRAKRDRGHVDMVTRGHGANTRGSEAQLIRAEAELKGGSIGKPDDWLGTYDRRINPGLRFPFELLNRFGWQVAAPGGGWREQAEG